MRPMASRVIRARTEATCRACGEGIQPGAAMFQDLGGWRHVLCPATIRALRAGYRDRVGEGYGSFVHELVVA